MEMNHRKGIKLAVLLLTSLLIAFASVAAYTEMFMHGTQISIGTAGVKFEAGADTNTMGGSDAINTPGTEVTFDQIPPIQPGETIPYDQAVNITNNSGSTKSINMSLYSHTGNFSTNFDYVNITIIAANGTTLGNSIEIVSSGTNVTSTGSLQMAQGETWTVKWIIKAKTGATNGHSFDITLKVKVE
jgi:hypothetical protein